MSMFKGTFWQSSETTKNQQDALLKEMLSKAELINQDGKNQALISEIHELVVKTCNKADYQADDPEQLAEFKQQFEGILKRHDPEGKLNTTNLANEAWEWTKYIVKHPGTNFLFSLVLSLYLFPPVLATGARATYSATYAAFYGGIPSVINPSYWFYFLPGREWAGYLAFNYSTPIASALSLPVSGFFASIPKIINEIGNSGAKATSWISSLWNIDEPDVSQLVDAIDSLDLNDPTDTSTTDEEQQADPEPTMQPNPTRHSPV